MVNFQVLSIWFQTLKREVFYFSNSGYAWNEKKKNESKRKHWLPEFFHRQEENNHASSFLAKA